MKTKRMTLKRVISVLLSMAMLISSVQSVFAVSAESFTDFPTGWSRPAMEAAVNNGLLVGVGENEIKPTNNLTRGEMAAIMVRAFGAVATADISRYTDVEYTAWYYDYIAKAVQMGAMTGKSETEMCPKCNITREEAFSVIARILALSDSDTSVLNKFNDAADISSWAAENLAALVNRGYVHGDDLGNMNPKANITREEFAQVMYATIRSYITEAGAYNGAMDGIVVVRVGNVELNALTVNGDLVIGDGAMKAPVKLNNVNVSGRFLTRGGTMTLTNTTVDQGVVVLNPNGITSFINYRNEPVFKDINEITKASFITAGSSGSGISGGSSITRYTITFNLDDGSEYKEIKVKKGSKIGNAMPDDPKKLGYNFDGWFDENGDKVTEDTKITKKLTVTAGFSLKEYDIFYKNKDGSAFSYFVDGYLPANKFNIETAYTMPGVDKLNLVGYTFKGWIDENGNPVTEVKVTEDTPDDGIVLYADLEVIDYDIVYKDKDGNAFTSFKAGYTPEATFNVEEAYVLPDADKLDLVGYTFKGWVDALGNPVTEVKVTKDTPATGLELYADVDLIEYDIVYKDEKGNAFTYFIAGYVPEATFNVEEVYVLPNSGNIYRKGYTFNGWKNASGNSVTEVTVTKDTPATGLELYADFTAITNTLKFVAEFKNGDSERTVDYTAENYDTRVLPGEDDLVIPTDKKFDGWYTTGGVPFDGLDESYITDVATVITLVPKFTDIGVGPTPPTTPPSTPETININFYRDYGADEVHMSSWDKTLELDADGFAQVTDDVIPYHTINPIRLKKSDYMPATYPDYDGQYRVKPTFWYVKDGKLVAFDTSVKLSEDTNVYLLSKEFAINADIEGFNKSITLSAKYSDDSRVIDSAKLLGHSAVNWLGLAKLEPKYNEIVDIGTDMLVSKNIMDADRNLKMLYLPAKISIFTTKNVADGMVLDKFQKMVTADATLDMLLGVADLDALIDYLGLSNTATVDEIKAHIKALGDDEKEDAANSIYYTLSSANEYKTLLDDLFKKKEITIESADIPYAKALNYAIQDLSVDEALDYTHNESVEKLVNLIGKDFITEKFDETKKDYCTGLDKAIEDVENGVASKKYTTSLRFKINPVEDVLKRLYDIAQPKVMQKLINADVHYDENVYLQYIVEDVDVVERLVNGSGVVNGEFIGYQLKDEVDYAKYMMEMLIAVDDALCWYGDDANLTDAQVDAIIDSVFAKVQVVHAKLNAFLEDYNTTGELPGGLRELIAKVEQINNIFTKLEPKLRSIIDKYLAHSINDKIQDGSLIENEKVLTAIDIMLGQEDPTFTIDSLYDVFYQYDDKMQAKLKTLVDSGKLKSAMDKAIAKAEASGKLSGKINMDKIKNLADDLYDELVNISNNGIDDYKVDEADPTVIDKYEISIGANVFSVMRALRW